MKNPVTRKLEVVFRDGEDLDEKRDLAPEELPALGEVVYLSRRRYWVVGRARHYGARGLLRIEVMLSRKSAIQRARDALGEKASAKARVDKGFANGEARTKEMP